MEIDDDENFIIETESTGGNSPILSRLSMSNLGGAKDIMELNVLAKLIGLSEKRLANGQYEEAALTCVKVIELGGNTTTPNVFNVHLAWLHLAKIHRIYGDVRRAKEFLKIANREAQEMVNRQPTEYKGSVASEWKELSKEESNNILGHFDD